MNVRTYAVVTGGYWAFTLTDGALRTLVLLHFHRLGYSPVAIAFLFLLYEAMGVVTNLVGGWIGARWGLNRILVAGLTLQVLTLGAMSLAADGWPRWWSVLYVMGLQALSGVAKDLTKLSSKSAVKVVAAEGALFRAVAVLTGSKNALKGAGFFAGAALLGAVGYAPTLWILMAVVGAGLVTVVVLLDADLGRAPEPTRLGAILSPSQSVNRLSVARLLLFGSRDIWFVVALPVALADRAGWSVEAIGAFLAAWVVGYGGVQAVTPRIMGGSERSSETSVGREVPAARRGALVLAAVTVALAVTTSLWDSVWVLVGGLAVFGVVFALNSSLHSYLILAYSNSAATSLDVGFYYSANAAGRLIGTLLSGLLALWGGLGAALWGSALFVGASWLCALGLRPVDSPGADPSDTLAS